MNKYDLQLKKKVIQTSPSDIEKRFSDISNESDYWYLTQEGDFITMNNDNFDIALSSASVIDFSKISVYTYILNITGHKNSNWAGNITIDLHEIQDCHLWHKRNNYELLYILDGEMLLYLENEIHHLSHGDAFFLSPEVLRAQEFSGDALVIHFYIPSFHVMDFLGNGLLPEQARRFFNIDNENKTSSYSHFYSNSNKHNIDRLIEAILEEGMNKESGYLLVIRGFLLRLINALDNQNTCCVNTVYKEASHAIIMFKKIETYLQQNCWNVTLSDTAEYFHYSASNINKIIKQCSGQSFVQYCKDHKFNYAKHLILYSDMSINSIISKLGYENRSYFFATFKKKFGMTPKEIKNTP